MYVEDARDRSAVVPYRWLCGGTKIALGWVDRRHLGRVRAARSLAASAAKHDALRSVRKTGRRREGATPRPGARQARGISNLQRIGGAIKAHWQTVRAWITPT